MTDATIQLRATVAHAPNAVRLDGFPLLAYAPKQWGEGVRTENNGTPVGSIAEDVAAGLSFAESAEKHGVTEAHARQAYAWAVIHGPEL
jgi:uncharacterized protein (DUF433 family)